MNNHERTCYRYVDEHTTQGFILKLGLVVAGATLAGVFSIFLGPLAPLAIFMCALIGATAGWIASVTAWADYKGDNVGVRVAISETRFSWSFFGHRLNGPWAPTHMWVEPQ